MIALLTARASVIILGKETEKEDIVLIDFEQNDLITFSLRKTEFANQLLLVSNMCAINILNATERQKDCCEIHEGRFTDKFNTCGFKKGECESIDCPCIENAEVIECSISQKTENKDEITYAAKVMKVTKK